MKFCRLPHLETHSTQVLQHSPRAAKYAAMLFLTGGDPDDGNKDTALRILQQFVSSSRCEFTHMCVLRRHPGICSPTFLVVSRT